MAIGGLVREVLALGRIGLPLDEEKERKERKEKERAKRTRLEREETKMLGGTIQPRRRQRKEMGRKQTMRSECQRGSSVSGSKRWTRSFGASPFIGGWFRSGGFGVWISGSAWLLCCYRGWLSRCTCGRGAGCISWSSDWYWRRAICSAPDLQQLGPRLLWGFSRGYVFEGLNLLGDFAKPFATSVASKLSPGVFPLPCDFSAMGSWKWPQGDFEHLQCVESWLLLVAAGLNSLHGIKPPFPKRRGGNSVKQCLLSLRDRVERFLKQGVPKPLTSEDVWNEVSSKRVSYGGEEIAVAQVLTLEQILPSLPPLGHGGSVELAPLLEGRTRFLIENPHEVVLGKGTPKTARNTAKVHLCPGEESQIFRLLFERGVIDFVPEDKVYSDSDGKYLSGLFGVPKPGKFSPSGKPTLRLIMNLIPINQALEVILGDIAELPSATAWQQLVLSEEDMITVSQADMASAFYLFRLPTSWLPYLCFNFRLRSDQAGFPGSNWIYPACRVLPMGWASSVGIMQMASRELIIRASTLTGDELRKQGSIPRWFVDWSKTLPSDNTWWQVYLDNFMAANVSRGKPSNEADRALHESAVSSWEDHGVLCSEDKHVYSTTVATELGVQIHSTLGLMGASLERIYKNVLGSLALVQQHRASMKMVQIILGRWIFCNGCSV